MIKLATSLLIILICISCGGNSNQPQSERLDQQTPVVLQENKVDYSSLKRNPDDLLDKLYDEIASKSTDLKELEKDFQAYQSAAKKSELNNKFGDYDMKSGSYYSAVGYKLANFQDSILRNRIADLVKKSKNQYADRTNELSALLATMDKTNVSITDYHNVLKIVKTLPVIEKYQKDNLPKTKEFNEHLSEQEKLLQKIKSLIDK